MNDIFTTDEIEHPLMDHTAYVNIPPEVRDQLNRIEAMLKRILGEPHSGFDIREERNGQEK